MQHTVNVIPQWREPARSGLYKKRSVVRISSASYSNAVQNISDGSDETYQLICVQSRG